jgi:hypothetical protein
MLPAWATITLALGSAAITGLVAITGSRSTVKVARLQMTQARRDAWETLRVAACEKLSGEAANVPIQLAAGNLIAATKSRDEAIESLARISFLFGATSDVTVKAEALTRAIGEFVRNPTDTNFSKRFPNDPFGDFYSASHDALKPPV